MKLYKIISFIVFCILTINNQLLSASLPMSIEGNYLIRLPGSSRYIKNNLTSFPENCIFSVPEKDNNASFSMLILDGHNIKLYPGTVFKVSKGSFYPMSGRFEFSSDENATNSLSIVANNCNAGYNYGHFLIEVTPDNGVFFALKNNGSVWVKDVYRKVFELKQGQQVQVPLFGETRFKSRVEAFWGKSPSSFGHLGEVGQETAYGIVGKELTITKTSKSSKDKQADEDDSEEDSSENDDAETKEDNEE